MNIEDLHPLLRRALIFLESGDIANADDYCEKYLDIEPEGAFAYVIKLMIRAKVTHEEDLAKSQTSFRNWNSYQNACRFADDELRKQLEKYLLLAEEEIQRKNEEAIAQAKEARWEAQYQEALKAQSFRNITSIEKAINLFGKIYDFKDSAIRIDQCRELLAKLQEEKQRQNEENERKTKAEKRRKGIIFSLVIIGFSVVAIFLAMSINKSNKARIPIIEENLIGSYSTSYFEGDIYNGGGVISTYENQTEYDITYIFKSGKEGTVNKTVRYDEEPFLTYNGERKWDSIDHYTETFTWDNLAISLFGKITVNVNGKECILTVNSADQPQSIEINGKTYTCN